MYLKAPKESISKFVYFAFEKLRTIDLYWLGNGSKQVLESVWNSNRLFNK